MTDNDTENGDENGNEYAERQPPRVAWLVTELEVNTDLENPLHVSIEGPYKSEAAAERVADRLRGNWERSLEEGYTDPYDLKEWAVSTIRLYDDALETLDREEPPGVGVDALAALRQQLDTDELESLEDFESFNPEGESGE